MQEFFAPVSARQRLRQSLFALKELVAETRTADQESKAKRILRLFHSAATPTTEYFANGEVPIPHLPEEEATSRFSFDIGQPLDGCAYVLNPCLENHYLQPALANERLVQEKLAAFIGINADLGAKRLESRGDHLPRRPLGGGMRRDVGMHDAPTGVGQYYQHEEQFQLGLHAHSRCPQEPRGTNWRREAAEMQSTSALARRLPGRWRRGCNLPEITVRVTRIDRIFCSLGLSKLCYKCRRW